MQSGSERRGLQTKRPSLPTYAYDASACIQLDPLCCCVQAPASARRELDAEWPFQPRPQHGPAAPLGQRSVGATTVASTLSSSPGGGARGGSVADASAEQGSWNGMPLNPEPMPALAASRARHWPRWSHAPGGLAADGAEPATRSADLDAGMGLRRGSAASAAAGSDLALAASGRRESAPLRHPGGAHTGGHQADPGAEGVGTARFDRTERAVPLPAEEGFQPEHGYLARRGSSGGRSGERAGGGVPSLPHRDAAHGASGRGQAGGTGGGEHAWGGGSAGSADPQGALSGYLGGVDAGQQEAEEGQVEPAEQGRPEARGAARAVNPQGWLFGHRGGAAASAAVSMRGETPEGRHSEVRGAAGAAYPQGRASGYHGAAGSALEEGGANDDMAAGSDLDEGVVGATGFPGRLSRHGSDWGGGRGQGSAGELDSPDDAGLPAEDADSAVQGLAAATGSRSDMADALEVSQLEPGAEVEDAEGAEWAAGEPNPEGQGLDMPGGASGALAGLSALGTVSALGRGSANPMRAEDSDLAAENDAEEEDTEALYPASAAQGGAKRDAGDLWRPRTAARPGPGAGSSCPPRP